MIPFEELGARWQGFVKEMYAEMPVYIGANVGGGAIAMIQSRVQKGQRADGGTFKPYSTKPTLVGSSSFVTKGASDKIFGSIESRRKADWKTVYSAGKFGSTIVSEKRLVLLEGGYAEIRKMEGRQTAHKDFERTGAMWKSTGVVRQWEYNVSVGGRDNNAIVILEGQADKEGISLLQLSSDEEKDLVNDITIKLKNMFEQWFT